MHDPFETAVKAPILFQKYGGAAVIAELQLYDEPVWNPNRAAKNHKLGFATMQPEIVLYQGVGAGVAEKQCVQLFIWN